MTTREAVKILRNAIPGWTHKQAADCLNDFVTLIPTASVDDLVSQIVSAYYINGVRNGVR